MKWLRDEAGSENGLTWLELKTGLTNVAVEHGHTISECMWKDIRAAFDKADSDNNGSISVNELEVALQHM